MAKRFALKLSYRGDKYAGWQIQKNAPSIQAEIQEKLSQLLQEDIAVIGCGRTDSGVHARNYTAHIELESELPNSFLFKINGMLSSDIVVHYATQVNDKFHARHDAVGRTYEYQIHYTKNPFIDNFSFYFPWMRDVSPNTLAEVTNLLFQYNQFFPFAKTGSDTPHYLVDLRVLDWKHNPELQTWKFTISANRFLRGMVRLVVGCYLQIATQKILIDDLKAALDLQSKLPKSLSVPAHGLSLVRIDYPNEIF